ncbi:Glyoxalase/Bleomycin resistance protein/Dihydroxybiphenyl dioxygenase [Aspergillus carlsbadensis]|nr:Glyoxalase/Bleomycin resistance protein/Dihydroxybiphenyl dioxygenase [Aspergillus carlsbadensis]
MKDTTVLRPSGLAHVVFKTAQYREMVDFWTTFLGAERVFENDFLTFLRYDDEHHRVAIGREDGIQPHAPTTAGLHHVAFTYGTLRQLLAAYRQRKELGIAPAWCVNHGPTTSLYYKDIDGNTIETQVDNFDTAQAATDFMLSKHFEDNPIGTNFDPDELWQKLEAGAEESTLKKRVEIGVRRTVEGL